MTRRWKSRNDSPPGRPSHCSSRGLARASAKIASTVSDGVPSHCGDSISASHGSVSGSTPSGLDHRRRGLLGAQQRRHEDAVDGPPAERLAQQRGLLEADLGEAGVLHGAAVTVPLGLAVADEDELHAR